MAMGALVSHIRCAVPGCSGGAGSGARAGGRRARAARGSSSSSAPGRRQKSRCFVVLLGAAAGVLGPGACFLGATGLPSRRQSAVASCAEAHDAGFGTRLLPTMPNSTEAMCRQAADAVMKAYRDGYTRQTVRLRTDILFQNVREPSPDSQTFHARSLPLAKSFATKLWAGESLQQVRVSQVDDDFGTLLYREAENIIMDSAVFYLPGRTLVTSPRVGAFFEKMGDRLVVLANTEESAEGWKVDNHGQDFCLTPNADLATEICETFDMQAYYYYQTAINNWQLTFFRVYPSPWQIFIEDLNYNLIRIGTSPCKPDYARITRWMEAYERKNDIAAWKKVGKMLKDNQARDGTPNSPLDLELR